MSAPPARRPPIPHRPSSSTELGAAGPGWRFWLALVLVVVLVLGGGIALGVPGYVDQGPRTACTHSHTEMSYQLAPGFNEQNELTFVYQWAPVSVCDHWQAIVPTARTPPPGALPSR